MLERFISLLAPHQCMACGCEGGLLCEWCIYDAVEELPERCYRCLGVSADSRVCSKCRKHTVLEHVWVRTQYADFAHDLVYALKFSRAKAAARVIASLLDESLPYLEEGTIITYVPTATSRVRVRGYDQTRLIARELATIRGLKCQRLLIRTGQARQVRSSKSQRAAQAAGSYRPVSGLSADRTVLLIDDIVTTGATLESAAKVLRSAGVKHVYAAAFAQKQ